MEFEYENGLQFYFITSRPDLQCVFVMKCISLLNTDSGTGKETKWIWAGGSSSDWVTTTDREAGASTTRQPGQTRCE